MELNTPFKLMAQQMETILSIFNSVLAVFTQPQTSNQGPEHPLSVPDIWKMNMNNLMSKLERISPGKLKLAGNQGKLFWLSNSISCPPIYQNHQLKHK